MPNTFDSVILRRPITQLTFCSLATLFDSCLCIRTFNKTDNTLLGKSRAVIQNVGRFSTMLRLLLIIIVTNVILSSSNLIINTAV